MNGAAITHHFYVDEAGDLTFFDRAGRTIIGQRGVSNVFMVGAAYLPNPQFAHELLEELRTELLADEYFQGVPSMQPSAGKTAIAFHAAKDLPEVRRDVMGRLRQCKAKVFVAIRRKDVLAPQVRVKHRMSGQKLTLRTLYEDLVKRVFRNILHKAERNEIVFAKQGKWVRREAMALAIERAKANFQAKYGIISDKPVVIRSASPDAYAGLQVIDYYLWALQRMYERGEDRFFNALRPAYRLVMDLDDKTNHEYGEWYSDDNPLTLKKIRLPAG